MIDLVKPSERGISDAEDALLNAITKSMSFEYTDIFSNDNALTLVYEKVTRILEKDIDENLITSELVSTLISDSHFKHTKSIPVLVRYQIALGITLAIKYKLDVFNQPQIFKSQKDTSTQRLVEHVLLT